MKPHRSDVLLAAAITAFGLVEVAVAEGVRGPRAVNALAVVAIGGLLAIRRRAPLGLGIAVLGAMALMAATLSRPDELAYYFLPVLATSFGFGVHLDRGRALVGLVAVVVAVQGINFIQGSPGDYFPILFMALAVLAGQVTRSRGRLAAELHEAAVQAEDARERAAAEAVADERRRIAREMHDVVAHSMSVMVVQAGGARRILERDTGRAEEAAAQIERTGREALREMRRLLGVLRPGEERLEPQPGLDALDGLVARARQAGLPVDLEVSGERPPLPAGLELAAFRIVQEGLTNAIKHAASAPTRVGLRFAGEQLEVVVENDGPPAVPEANGREPGHGLVGMRERVRLFGGDLRAGPREGGGFRVHATLPTSADT